MNAIELIAAKSSQISAGGQFDAQNGQLVPSPCVSVCRMAPGGGHCEGCFRTLEEIATWSRASAGERLHIWRQLLLRAGLAHLAPALFPMSPPPESSP